MSHGKEREEKICLNCQAPLFGYYCHVCGQENREPKDSVWGLISHFFNDITHFDSKFFTTLKPLFFRPGFLSLEYIKGRRADYLNPVRMYVFTSAVFFIIFFTVYDVKQLNLEKNIQAAERDSNKIEEVKKQALARAKTREDSLAIEKLIVSTGTIPLFTKDTAGEKNRPKARVTWGGAAEKYKSVHEYDSAQLLLPESEKDGYIQRMIARKSIELKQKYRDNQGAFLEDLLENFMHSFPKILFISLPLFALVLKLLYIRRRKYYYVDHGIFLVHLYIFTFLFLLIYFGLERLRTAFHLSYFSLIYALMFGLGIFYAYKAMRNFYGQGRFKTLVKFIILNFFAFTFIIILFGLFFGISAMSL